MNIEAEARRAALARAATDAAAEATRRAGYDQAAQRAADAALARWRGADAEPLVQLETWRDARRYVRKLVTDAAADFTPGHPWADPQYEARTRADGGLEGLDLTALHDRCGARAAAMRLDGHAGGRDLALVALGRLLLGDPWANHTCPGTPEEQQARLDAAANRQLAQQHEVLDAARILDERRVRVTPAQLDLLDAIEASARERPGASYDEPAY